MKFVIQVVSEARVEVDGETVGQIGKGFLVLIGIGQHDTGDIADKMVDKLIKLRIFDDEHGKTNLSLNDVGGSLLLVSQFTLYANCRKGNRPSFTEAGDPHMSEALYDYICDSLEERVRLAAESSSQGPDQSGSQQKLRGSGSPAVERGVFGADMRVSLVNEGPFTVVLDSDEILSGGGHGNTPGDKSGKRPSNTYLSSQGSEVDSLDDELISSYHHLTESLIKQSKTISTMESCTGGLIGALLSDCEGSSGVFSGGVITYSNEEKIRHGVDKSIIETYGVYSARTAEDMAEAVRREYGTDIGVGVTGSIGRIDPANKDSIPGEVYIAVAADDIISKKITLKPGDRWVSRQQIAAEVEKLLSDKI